MLSALMVLALAATMIALTSLGGASAASAAEGYDGETLFEGLYFGTGPAAEHFPDIQEAMQDRRDASPDEDAVIRQLEEALITSVKEADDTFMARFERDITSGDHLAIEAALVKGTERLDAAAHHVLDTQPELIDQVKTEAAGLCVAVTLYVAGNVAIYVNAVIAANIVYYINWMWSLAEDDPESDLQREQWIHDIAVTFGSR